MLTPDEKHVYEAITPEQRAQFCLDAAELMIDTGTHQRKYNPGSGPELPVPLRASVTLLAKGGQEIEVERDVAYLSGTIKNMLEGAEDEAVPLPNVGSGTLRMVLIYLQYHFEATKMSSSVLHGFTRVGELSAARPDLPNESGSPSPTNADLSRAKPFKTQGILLGHAGHAGLQLLNNC